MPRGRISPESPRLRVRWESFTDRSPKPLTLGKLAKNYKRKILAPLLSSRKWALCRSLPGTLLGPLRLLSRWGSNLRLSFRYRRFGRATFLGFGFARRFRGDGRIDSCLARVSITCAASGGRRSFNCRQMPRSLQRRYRW